MAKEVAQKLRLHNCSFEMIDIFDNQFDTTFDAIISIDVLEHIKDDFDVLQKLHGLLTEQGKLIIHVPHYYRHLFGMTRLNFPDIEGHERIGYRLEEIENLLVKAKFRIVEKGYTYSSWKRWQMIYHILSQEGGKNGNCSTAWRSPCFWGWPG